MSSVALYACLLVLVAAVEFQRSEVQGVTHNLAVNADGTLEESDKRPGHRRLTATHEEKRMGKKREDEGALNGAKLPAKHEETETLPFSKPAAKLVRTARAAKFTAKEEEVKQAEKASTGSVDVHGQETGSSHATSGSGTLDAGYVLFTKDCTQGMEQSNTSTCPAVQLGAICESFYYLDTSGGETKYKACRFTPDNLCLWVGDSCHPNVTSA
mmetsp:Transcript_81567/g.144034  ORF Transcript_81567/g.144034 Transcript_81567/m.144034 type:complete len:213 (+) Transcript_81567:106-744(+)|eukprot:CAMPEP_0197662228 /NCGR_PEP_ID=MMETSP1338-20131121/52552_1 /TAXON_ID=43686 ORGANISM="Pelagodinium beii, Strain RCC1491" /NCGR_SAMPLE_ID=MMETSP1338 /ASSEMBLY_ACC=CAM_ASM_000754 /LENGTH=212 /DNA_ID=CAMNT_0043239971 /DNA_START=110 /DNA_END=748 /DNA_ORIENTATION=-